MDNAFYRSVHLAHLFDWTEPLHHRLNWLFVTSDSDRDVLTTKKYLAPKLKELNILFQYGPEGLWLFSTESVKPYVRDHIAEPFSACYIFDEKIKNCSKPSFDLTTDQERPFDDSEMTVLTSEIKRVNAIGYAADGCGLQWISLDNVLTRSIHQGFEAWQKAIPKGV